MAYESGRGAWTEPGAYEVAPGVHRIPLPLPLDGLRAVNVYAVATPSELVLIDSGWALEASRALLAESLAVIGRSLADVDRFLVTHVHRDHFTQALTVRREFGSRISLGAGEKDAVAAMIAPDWSPVPHQLRALRRHGAIPLVDRLVAERYGEDISEHCEEPDDWLDGRVELELADRRLLAIPTPGHTKGHYVFADLEGGVLFSGDHVLPHITPSIGLEAVPGALPLRDYLDSLRAMLELPDLRMLPAHGPPGSAVHARVDELLSHHAGRLDACEAAARAGTGTAYETARTLRWTRHERHIDELDGFNQMLAVLETVAHLEVLVTQGRLRRVGGDTVAYEAPAV